MARESGSPPPEVSPRAIEHGEQRLRLGFDVALVVREYGLLTESLLEVAVDANIAMTVRDMEMLSRWVNAGIADAVSEYTRQRHDELRRQAAEQTAFFSHELRNPMSAARIAVSLLRRGLQISSTRPLDVLERSLTRLQKLVDDQLTDLRTRSGVDLHRECFAPRDLLDDVVAESTLHAEDKSITLTLEAEPTTMVDGDPLLLRSAFTNLVRNAVKFTDPSGRVVVRASEAAGRLFLEVEDRCGGLAPGTVEVLLNPFVQMGKDRSGFGLGLGIARQAIDAHGGTLDIRNLPGTGCVFVDDLPILAAKAPAPPSPSGSAG